MSRIIVSTIVIYIAAHRMAFSEATLCPHAGKIISKNQLQFILKNHNELISEHSDKIELLDNTNKLAKLIVEIKNDPRFANLCSANLLNANFSNANLFSANLSGALLSNSLFELANLDQANLSRAKLSNATLTRASMSGVNLKNANLYRATLNHAVLTKANLSNADLSNSSLYEANLSETNLSGTNFSNANLISAFMASSNLTNAQFKKSDLTNANLINADLSNTVFIESILLNVNLEGANLTNANFEHANLQGVNYLPKINTYPNVTKLAHNESLYLMTYINNSSGLHQLRYKFKKLGFRHAERKLTYAIRHTGRSRNNKSGIIKYIDEYFNYVFFEYPTNWSMYPEKALIILISLILVFTLPYSVSIYKTKSDGIWLIWNSSRIRQDLGHNEARLITGGFFKSLFIGFQFSILSAFHIGWKDLNIGNWISSIQPREYSLYATGWVRTVSAIQSLISVYLVAAWALTYFGRPFG